ncbi:MAG: hypothetical protein MJ211_08785 [Bacteroidales bacterium]|nr:hypothetical protein [Bacteroidales bacterium]
MKKILYLLSLVLIGGGVIASVIGAPVAGIFGIASGAVLSIATFLSGKLIDASNQATFDNGNLSLEMKINNQISESRKNKFKAESEIRRLTAWSNDAIFTAYSTVAQQEGELLQRENLLDNYETIKNKYVGKIDFSAETKCDNLVSNYKTKIDGYKERIEIFDKKQQEYTILKEKIKAVKQKEKIMQRLENHNNKLEQADQNELQSMAAGEYDLSQLTMGDVEKEVFEKEEYFRQLEQAKILENL